MEFQKRFIETFKTFKEDKQNEIEIDNPHPI